MSNIGFDEKDLDSLSPKEREFALKILKEMESEGKSKTYDDLIYADYKEIPVDIVTFLHEPKYLGNALLGDEGKFTLFPYWEEKLKEIFPDNLTTKYNTAIFTGAIGLGKSTVAVIAVLYQLYRMMCLKNPYAHYGLQEIDLITFAFMNITLDAAKGVAWDKCQQMLQRSEWFMERGQMSTGGTPTWKPPQGIELITGSLPRHIIGRAVFACLDGDTVINTSDGDVKISECVNKDICVFNYKDGEAIKTQKCTVKPTIVSDEEYQIELDDGTLIKCTGNHKFLLTNGKYVEAQYLTEDDDIVDFPIYGYVYKTTNIVNGKIYIGQKASSTFLGNKYLGSGSILRNAIRKYGSKSFVVECLEICKDKKHLDESEKKYIQMYNSTDKAIGYNISCGGQGGNLGDSVNRKISDKLSGVNNPMYGKHWSEEKKKEFSSKSSIAWESDKKREEQSIKLKGKRRTLETRKKISVAVNRRYTESPETFSNGLLGKVAITNGNETKYICKTEKVPNGWHYGNATKGRHFKLKMDAWTDERRRNMSDRCSGKNNPMYGKGSLVSGGKNGHANKIYIYNNVEYMCRNDLKFYLNSIGYNVTDSSLKALTDCSDKNHSRVNKKFADLVGKITWRYK